MSDEPLFYFTDGEIYGMCLHKHQTWEEAKQCCYEYKQQKCGDQEFRVIKAVMPETETNWYKGHLLGHGEYELPGNGTNSILYARNLFLDSVHSLRKHVLEELREQISPIFAPLHPDIHHILAKVCSIENVRQAFLNSYTQEELESEFEQYKKHYHSENASFPEFLKLLQLQQLTGRNEIIWTLSPPKEISAAKNKPQKTRKPSDGIFDRQAPKPVNDTLYYWESIELAATIYHKENDTLIKVYQDIKAWASKWKLIDIGLWCLDRTVETLILWCQNPKAREKLYWKLYDYSCLSIFTEEEIFFSIHDEGWNPLAMTEKNFKAKIKEKFDQYLDEYTKRLCAISNQRGLQKIDKVRDTTHLEWLVKYTIRDVINGQPRKTCPSMERIASKEKVDRAAISRGIKKARKLLGENNIQHII